jgi:anti-anti-sigma factor
MTTQGTFVIRPWGHVDVAAVAALHPDGFAVHDRDVPATVVVDLVDVLVLDPDALAALVQLRRRLQPHNGRLLIRGASPHLQAVLALTGLDRFFPDADQPAALGF